MVAARIGHGCIAASRQRVIAAHHALQFREFANHVRAQIGLGDLSRLGGFLRVRPHHRRDLARQGGDARDPRGLRAKLGVEGDRFQPRDPIAHPGARHAQIVFPKEFRIRQAGGENLLISRQNRCALIGGLDIGDGHETFDPACLGVADGKEFLMLAHRGLQHLGR